MPDDLQMMRRALSLAEKGAALTSPGAMVGAVIVTDDRPIAEAFYTYDGVKHAEILALEQAGSAARGATVYTSLEPCSHHGRTGPCAQALIEAGVARVVTAMQDPNPDVNGQGLTLLRNAGISVETGVLEQEARKLNEAFTTSKTQHRPFGVLKIAMTLDGKIATSSGESKWITSEESRAVVQELRHRVDAVVTGSGTSLRDNPRLTDRTGRPRRRPLMRVVLDRRVRVDHAPGFVLFRGSLRALTDFLHKDEIQSFLLECGPDLAFDALANGLIDKIVAFIAPKVLGGRSTLAIGGDGFAKLSDALQLKDVSWDRVGPDLVITAYVHRHH
jgi:diaminohydroxyphosphoribosylaminopyrimidine deaminase/5-amino-6-(5-phosphoribosylamino)uracil reductase